MKYTIDYFIEKFSKIPENEWEIGILKSKNKSCALGHCGVKSINGKWEHSVESQALVDIFDGTFESVYDINDGNLLEFGNNPKIRMINALKLKKEKSNV
jgi:hypothetical protein